MSVDVYKLKRHFDSVEKKNSEGARADLRLVCALMNLVETKVIFNSLSDRIFFKK